MKLKSFGYLCFSFVPKVKRDKLDKQLEMRIFVGYSDTSKAYRIYLPQTNKIVVSRDVKFLKTKKWSWDEKMQQYNDENVDELPVRGTRKLSDIYCYVAVTAAVNQVLWLRKLLIDLDMKQEMSTQVFVDNQAAISIANDPVFHGKTKYFKIKLYFLREV